MPDEYEPYMILYQHEIFKKQCRDIEEHYDGDNDTMPGLPRVTFTEMALLQLIIKLETRVHDLEEERRLHNE